MNSNELKRDLSDVLSDSWLPLDAEVAADALDTIGNNVQLHYLAVDDRIVRKILITERDQAKLARFAVKFDHLYRTRTDVQTGHTFLFTEHYFSCSLVGTLGAFFIEKFSFVPTRILRVFLARVGCHLIEKPECVGYR